MSIDFDLTAWLIGFTLLGMLLVLEWRRIPNLPRLLFIALFGFYLLCVIRWTVFPIYIFPARALQVRFMDGVNLIPFYFGPFTPLAFAWPGLLLNTLLTMPVGFGISFITRFRVQHLPGLVVAFGVGIEGVQLLISLILGYAYRTIDVNDVICNSLGVLLGYAAFRIFARLYLATVRRFNLHPSGLFHYIQQASNQAG